LGKILRMIRRALFLKKLKRQLNIDATVSVLEGPNMINVLTRSGDKVITSIRGSLANTRWHRSFKLGLIKKMIIGLYNRSDKVVVNSKGQARDINVSFGIKEDKILVIHNFLDIDKIDELANEELTEAEKQIFKKQVITYTGRFTDKKGQNHLIRTFGKVRESNPDVRLFLMGDGEWYDYLLELCDGLGLRSYRWDMEDMFNEDYDVYFAGFKENPHKYNKAATIYAFPSLTEGFPNGLTEAMACGTPVISADCRSGPRELLEPESDFKLESTGLELAQYGILMPVCYGKKIGANEPLSPCEEIWVDGMSKLLNDVELRDRYAKLARERARHFKLSEITSQWESLF
ncbi:MAG: glycosyltransferase, partial [Bacteroidetes bacterium]|nr:glycosyltransferase [Bacteroidota bacterium]